jgi:hypothetical protein
VGTSGTHRASHTLKPAGEFDNITSVIGSKTNNKQVVINDYIKVWSDGIGKSVSDIKSLK